MSEAITATACNTLIVREIVMREREREIQKDTERHRQTQKERECVR